MTENVYVPLKNLFDALEWKCDKSGFQSMGEALANIVGRENPYTYRYLRSVLYRNYKPGKRLSHAIELAGATLDGIPLTIAEAETKTVYTPPGLDVEYAYLITPARLCASTDCFNKFIPNIWNRKYCYLCRPIRGNHNAT